MGGRKIGLPAGYWQTLSSWPPDAPATARGAQTGGCGQGWVLGAAWDEAGFGQLTSQLMRQRDPAAASTTAGSQSASINSLGALGHMAQLGGCDEGTVKLDGLGDGAVLASTVVAQGTGESKLGDGEADQTGGGQGGVGHRRVPGAAVRGVEGVLGR